MPDEIAVKLQKELDEHLGKKSMFALPDPEPSVGLGVKDGDMVGFSENNDDFTRWIFTPSRMDFASAFPGPFTGDRYIKLEAADRSSEAPDIPWPRLPGIDQQDPKFRGSHFPRGGPSYVLAESGKSTAPQFTNYSSSPEYFDRTPSAGNIPLFEPAFVERRYPSDGIYPTYNSHGDLQLSGISGRIQWTPLPVDGPHNPMLSGSKNSSSKTFSNLTFATPANVSSNLCQLVLSIADMLYKSLDQLDNSGVAIGFDILLHDIPLAYGEDRGLFTGIKLLGLAY